MSSPIQPSGMSPTGTTRVSASAAKRSATTTSLGSSSRQPRSRASPIAFRAIAWPLSSSCRDAPTARPSATRKVKAIAPPIRIESASWVSRSMTPILSATLTPPITTTNGRAGLSSRFAKASSSASSSSPAADGSCCAIPTVDACARCTAPKASCTNRSPLAASSAAKPESLASSRASKRRFSSIRSSPCSSPKAISRPSSSDSRSATGRSDSSGLGSPLGRPRCEHTTTCAPSSSSSSMVGTAARMRVSSAT